MWLQHKKKSYYQIFCQFIVFSCVSFFLYIFSFFSSFPELKSSVRYRWPWEISPSSKATSSSHGDNSFNIEQTLADNVRSFNLVPMAFFFLLSAPRPCKGKGPGNEIGDRSQVWPKWWVNKKVKLCVLSQRQTVVSFYWDQDDYSPKNSFFDICPSLSLSCFLMLSSIVNSAIRGLSYRNENIKLSFTIFNY